jgi:hypothetical protein
MVLTTSGAAQVGGALTQAERTLAADALYFAELNRRPISALRQRFLGISATLDAGHVILPGSCTRACDVAAQQTVRADFDVLGSVTTRFD